MYNSSRKIEEMGSIQSLGSEKTKYNFKYDPTLLEYFENKHLGNDYWVSLEAFEFTSLCPKTGQPDWATIYINYIPNLKMVESKSLKLYLMSFRNHGDFHEDVINIITNDLVNLMNPKYIEVFGNFNSRGGISIYPFVSRSLPEYQDLLKHRQFNYSMNYLKSKEF